MPWAPAPPYCRLTAIPTDVRARASSTPSRSTRTAAAFPRSLPMIQPMSRITIAASRFGSHAIVSFVVC